MLIMALKRPKVRAIAVSAETVRKLSQLKISFGGNMPSDGKA